LQGGSKAWQCLVLNTRTHMCCVHTRTQVAAKLAGKDGVVVASDILEMKPLPNVVFVRGDFTHDSVGFRV
jgi:hypothetical protein